VRKTIIARRYAKALIETGQETGTSKEIGRELRDISAIFSYHPELYAFLLNPMYKLEERIGLIENISKALKFSDIVKRFLSLIVKGRKTGLLQDICDAYCRMEDDAAGRIRASVESAADINDNIKTDIKERLEKMTGREVILTTGENRALIGGFVVRVGNVIFDGSIRTQLERVKTRLKEGAA